jgi:hypothetical protein
MRCLDEEGKIYSLSFRCLCPIQEQHAHKKRGETKRPKEKSKKTRVRRTKKSFDTKEDEEEQEVFSL